MTINRRRAKTKSRETLPNLSELTGSVCVQWRKSGDKLRAYHYRFWREYGRLRKQYVKLADVETVSAACDANRHKRKAWRAEINAARREYRSIIETLKREVLGL